MTLTLPTEDAYWVQLGQEEAITGRLLAGEYPGAKDTNEALAKLDRFLDSGISFFLDLTEEGEYNLRPYATAVQQRAASQGLSVTHRRMPIRDLGTPDLQTMHAILDTLDAALARGESVYVHCFGGIGRTGTVVGCWLVRHGLTGEEALAQIAAWRQGTPDGKRPSPETAAQRQMVRQWVE